MDLVFKAIGALLVFGSVLFLAYVTTKYVGGKTGRALRGKYIQIVETVSLGVDKHLHLVKVAEEYILISSSGKNIEFLSNIKVGETEPEMLPDDTSVFDFKSFFEKYLQNWKVTKSKSNIVEFKSNDVSESVGGDVFKSNLNRLRTITKKTDKDNQGPFKKDGDENTDEVI